MNQHEIEIFRMSDDTEMLKVQEALYNAGISDAGDPEVGMYLEYGHSRSVFVDPSDLGAAVEILNGLGYETDEDENEAE